MEIVSIIRVLWTRRLWVSVGFAVALAVGLVITYNISLGIPPKLESRQYHVGVAEINLLVDTPSSQVADLRPPIGADVLGARASLFASLISTPPLRVLIAKHAGIPPELLTTSPSAAPAGVPTALAQAAPQTADRSNTYSLKVTTQETLPIIEIAAEAPDARRAALLANGTFEALKEYLATVAEQQQIPRDRRAAVTAFGTASSSDVVRGPGRLIAFLVALFAFGLICVAIVIAAGLARSWREAAASEQVAATPADAPLQPATAAQAESAPQSIRGGRRSPRPPAGAETAPHHGAVPAPDEPDVNPLDQPERVTSIARRGR